MTTYHKVLVNGASCHGGNLKWSLPTQRDDGTWEPSDWHEVAGEVEACRNGLHLTSRPWECWPKIGATAWEAEIHPDAECDPEDDKIAVSKCRLIGPGPEAPDWWQAVERFVTEEIPAMRWLDNHADPLPEWHMFDTRDAARDAAWFAARGAAQEAARGAAWGAAREAAQEAARDADLVVGILFVSDIGIDARHTEHAMARWEVWRRGYGLLCASDGELYVYRKVQ